MPRTHLFFPLLLAAAVVSTAAFIGTRTGPGSARTHRTLPGKPPLPAHSRPVEPRLDAYATADPCCSPKATRLGDGWKKAVSARLYEGRWLGAGWEDADLKARLAAAEAMGGKDFALIEQLNGGQVKARTYGELLEELEDKAEVIETYKKWLDEFAFANPRNTSVELSDVRCRWEAEVKKRVRLEEELDDANTLLRIYRERFGDISLSASDK